VKGLLSSKINGDYIFRRMLEDLQDPAYAVRTLPAGSGHSCDAVAGEPIERKNSSYVIRAEDHGVPQRRHRVILLGFDVISISPALSNSSPPADAGCV
jgi:DNA (cytosine-5)-methyltransferase 1